MSDLKEFEYKPDLEILDRYLIFSSELLRISLLALGAFGTLFLLKNNPDSNFFHLNIWTKTFLIFAVAFFVTSAALALAHRFYGPDSMACHIKYLRITGNDEGKTQEKIKRNNNLKKCEKFLLLSAINLIAGIILFSIALFTAPLH